MTRRHATHRSRTASALVVLVVCGLAIARDCAAAERTDDAALLRAQIGTDWVHLRLPSIHLLVRPGAWPTATRLAAVEVELQRIAARLEVGDGALSSLREDPIDYFLVTDPRTMDRIGAGEVEGLAYPESRLIVSTRLPHEHELAHVLMHLALPGRPGASHQFLQEGLASYLGGNGAEGEFAVLAHGDRVLDRVVVDLAALWTQSGWDRSPLDAFDRYAVAARFVQFLVEGRGDMATMRELARLLAGRAEEIAQRPWSAIRVQLEGTYAAHWDDLVEEFDTWRRTHPVAGVREVEIPVRAADLVAADERHTAQVWIEPGGWVFAVRAQRGPLDVDLFWGEPERSASAVTAAPSSGHRFRLHLDDAGLVLVDQHYGRTLLRRNWQERDFAALPAAAAGVAPAGRVLRIGAVLTERLGAPSPLGLWSRPVFQTQ